MNHAKFLKTLLAAGGNPWQWQWFWQPLAAACLFIAGQTLTFLALERGDVSIATPVLGSKTIYVAWFSSLLGARLPWLGARVLTLPWR